MSETLYGLVELIFVFGVVIILGLWQLTSIEKTRKRLREEQSVEEKQD